MKGKGKDKAHREPASITITIGADGRMYWHELGEEMFEVALAVCPEEPALACRLRGRRKEDDGNSQDAASQA